jgi:hypothetical protein
MNPDNPAGQRKRLGGWLVLVMVLGAMLAGLTEASWSSTLFALAALSGWIAAVLLFMDISRAQKIQVGIMPAVGVGLLAVARTHGAVIDSKPLLSGNIGLLTMVTAVGFLRMVSIPGDQVDQPLPVGKGAYLGTLLGTGILEAVINLSGAILIADRLDHHRPLGRFASQSITRIFTGCAGSGAKTQSQSDTFPRCVCTQR